MTNSPVDAKAAHKDAHAHPHASKAAETGGASHVDAADEFLSSVKALKEAEKAAAQSVEEARKEAARIEAQGREHAVEIASRASEKAVQAKNELLTQGREKAEKEVSELLHEAKKQAEKIRGKRLSDRDVEQLSTTII